MKKEHKSKTGGLTAAGRAHFKRTEGANLKAPVSKGKNPRRISFAVPRPATVPRGGPARARVTQGYGAAAWLLAEGRTAEAVEALRTVIGIGATTAF